MRLSKARFELVLLVAGAVMGGGACHYLDARHMAATSITAAPLGESAASPPVLLFRLTRVEVALDPRQRDAIEDLEASAEAAVATLERERAAYRDVLARGVERGALEPGDVGVARDRVLGATEDAARSLGPALARLHAILRPEQRAHVAFAVDRWLAGRRPAPEHGWLASFARPSLGPDTLAEMAAALHRDAVRWTANAERTVRYWMPRVDAEGRRELVLRLRTDTLAVD